jgi:hypothetical protein
LAKSSFGAAFFLGGCCFTGSSFSVMALDWHAQRDLINPAQFQTAPLLAAALGCIVNADFIALFHLEI